MVCMSDFPHSCLEKGINLVASILAAKGEGKGQK